MVYDHNTWMPGDGPLQEWLNSKQAPQESEYVHYYVGVDLGKKRNPSTLAVIEARWSYGNPTFLVVYLKRFRLSMYYTDIAKQLAKADVQLKQIAAKRGKTAIILYALDATGLGGPICELVEKAMPEADIRKCYITGGINTVIAPEDPYEYHIPKGQLISGLMAAFDSKTLHITRRSKEFDAVVDELTNFEIHISESGRDSYYAAPLKHDDLVVALSLAIAFAYMDGDSSAPIYW